MNNVINMIIRALISCNLKVLKIKPKIVEYVSTKFSK